MQVLNTWQICITCFALTDSVCILKTEKLMKFTLSPSMLQQNHLTYAETFDCADCLGSTMLTWFIKVSLNLKTFGLDHVLKKAVLLQYLMLYAL